MGALSGLSAKEALIMPPGLLYDIFELYLKSVGYKKDDPD